MNNEDLVLTNIEKSKIVFKEILEKRDFSWIDKLFSDFYGIREGKEFDESNKDKKGSGKLGVRLYLNTFIQAFEDVNYTFLNTIECDNQVVLRWKVDARHVEDLFSIKATNKKLSVIGVSWFFFDSQNLIRNVYLIWNGFSLMDQLNLEVVPKGEKNF